MESYNFNGEKLCRLDDLQLIDELPADILPVFSSDGNDLKECQLCACGILIVAKQQRQLIEQSLLSEIFNK